MRRRIFLSSGIGLILAPSVVRAQKIPNFTAPPHTAAPSGATWSPSVKSPDVTLSNSNMTAASNTAADAAGLATLAITSGQKIYFEATVDLGSSNENGIGFGNASTAVASGDYLGQDGNSLCVYGHTGNIYQGGSNVYGGFCPFSSGDRIGAAIDRTNVKLWMINITGGQSFGGAYDPATNSGGFVYSVTGNLYVGYNVGWDGTNPGTISLIAPGSFTNAPPSGFIKYG